MEQCHVLRCTHEDGFHVTLSFDPSKPSLEVVVCSRHKALIEAGEPFALSEFGPFILMGDDIPAPAA